MSAPTTPRDQAATLLGVSTGATPEQVRAALRAKARELHTDTGGAGGDIHELTKARDILLTAVPNFEAESQETHCQICGGVGMVSTGFGSRPCVSCGGSGNAL